MRRMPWATLLWPGLPQLWTRGSWSALGVAVLAAALLNWVLLGTWVWSELIAQGVRSTIWATLGLVWAGSAVHAVIQSHRSRAGDGCTRTGDGVAAAIEPYLKGDWFEAERLLNEALRRDIRDLDARLMLATLLRHTARFDEAAQQLDELSRCDGAEKWELEIRREREFDDAHSQART